MYLVDYRNSNDFHSLAIYRRCERKGRFRGLSCVFLFPLDTKLGGKVWLSAVLLISFAVGYGDFGGNPSQPERLLAFQRDLPIALGQPFRRYAGAA